MADETKTPREIEFFFEYDPNYRLVAANGIWGGVTTRGDIRLDFFVEHTGVPDSVKHWITPEGKLGEEINRKPDRKITRRLQVGVLLSLDSAESIANFIREKIADFRKTQQKEM